MLDIIFSLNTLWWLILLLYIPACFGLIIIVLLQKGKGQGLAGAFGMGGGMDTIFGPRSSKSLPQKITYASAGIFMMLALVMSILSGRVGRQAAPELVDATPAISMESLFTEGEAPATEAAATVVEGEAVSSEATPVEVTPVEAAPAEATPVEVTPVEAAPAEATPVEVTPVEVTPVEATPAEAAPIEVTPAEAAPAADAAPVEAAPAADAAAQ
ncbi:MAG: preprotein translocase subunit SecG [Candidatus Hydrogenedentes bacterium]|nr:preprotein translocase subunit SecG [Candidatus Hydrogenedentota bacterium]